MSAQISPAEYRQRLSTLQKQVAKQNLGLFIITSLESIFYLTGAGFEPLERPFFLLIVPDRPPTLLVPKLDQEHMKKAIGIDSENIITYREYPAPKACGWASRIKELLIAGQEIGIEPTIRREITDELSDFRLRTAPLVEQLRVIKSQAEIAMIRRAAHYADFGVKRLLSASYYGARVAEGFAETRTVSTRIIREVENWDPLTTKVLMATWAAPRSAMPHSVPSLHDQLNFGPHVSLVLIRVNGYAAESERTYFTSPPSTADKAAFAAMMEARRLAFEMIKPGVGCSELDLAVNEFLNKEGYAGEDKRLHRIGHGIGLGTHEAPWLAEGSDDRLAENMIISIEPGPVENFVSVGKNGRFPRFSHLRRLTHGCDVDEEGRGAGARVGDPGDEPGRPQRSAASADENGAGEDAQRGAGGPFGTRLQRRGGRDERFNGGRIVREPQ